MVAAIIATQLALDASGQHARNSGGVEFSLNSSNRACCCLHISSPRQQSQVLQSGLEEFANFGDSLDDYAPADRTLPLVDTSLGGALDVGGVLRTLLSDPAISICRAAGTPTATVWWLRCRTSLTTATAELSVDSGFGVTGGLAFNGDELLFEVHFAATRDFDADFDLGANAPSQGLRLGNPDSPPTVPLDPTLVVDFSFGLDLTDGSVGEDDFFLRAGGKGPACFNCRPRLRTNRAPVSFQIVAGFTQPTVQNATVSLDAGLDVTFGNPDG